MMVHPFPMSQIQHGRGSKQALIVGMATIRLLTKQPMEPFTTGRPSTPGKLCPTGWHVPTDKEWRALTDNLGIEMVCGQRAESGYRVA